MKFRIEQIEEDTFALTYRTGGSKRVAVYLSLEEAKDLHSDLEKHLHDLWIQQHGMD